MVISYFGIKTFLQLLLTAQRKQIETYFTIFYVLVCFTLANLATLAFSFLEILRQLQGQFPWTPDLLIMVSWRSSFEKSTLAYFS